MISSRLILVIALWQLSAVGAWCPNTNRRHQTTTTNPYPQNGVVSHSFLSLRQATNPNTDDGNNDDNDGIDPRWEDVVKELDDKDENQDGDDSSTIVNSIGKLRQEVRQQGFQKTPMSSRSRASSSSLSTSNQPRLQASDFPSNPGPLSEMEDIETLSQMFPNEEGDQFLNDYDTEALEDASNLLTEEDSVFLDADAYVQYSNMEMGAGGLTRDDYDGYNTRPPPSISEQQLKEFAMPPNAPYNANNAEEPTFDDILALHRTMNQRRTPTADEEKAIFDEIFKDEKAYLEQTSALFREGLTNKTAAEEASHMRRSSGYRKAHLKDLNRLEQQIQEFEVLLNEQEETNKNTPVVEEGTDSETVVKSMGSIASSLLKEAAVGGNDEFSMPVEDDTVAAKSTPTKLTEAEPEEEWVLVDDPDTGEIFYWNSVTGEMSVDPPP
jgi:hypothetical protein